VHDIVIVNDDLETAYKEMEDFIFGRGKGTVKTQEQDARDGGKAGESVLD
jgi:guanylate kinase